MTRRMKIEDYHVGDKTTFTKTITETDSTLFGGISGDFYPIHFNEELAKKTRFGGRIVTEVITERHIVNLDLTCRNQRGEDVIKGKAVLKVLKEVITEE